MSQQDPLLTVSQLANREGVSRWTVYKWMSRHSLPHMKRGGLFIRWSEFVAWLNAGRRA